MFYSHSFLSSKGPLGAIWVAAYCFKKLRKAEVAQTDISSSVDKILQDEFDVVTYRVLAYLLLGVVRIFSKKVEYLFDDCNKALLKIKNFVVSNKERALVEALRAPYLSITLPERFELDAFNLEILEDSSGGNVVPHEDITLKDSMWKTGAIVPYSLDKDHNEEFAAELDICSPSCILNEDVLSSLLLDFDMALGTSHNFSSLNEKSIDKFEENRSNLHESMELEKFSMVEEVPLDIVQSYDEDQHNKSECIWAQEAVVSDEMFAERSMQELWDDSIFQEAGLSLQIFGESEEEPVSTAKSFGEHHQTDGEQIKVPDMIRSENENHEVIKEDCNTSNVGGGPVNTAKSFGEHHQTNGEQIKFPNMVQSENENYEVNEEGCNVSNLGGSIEKLRGNTVAQEEYRVVEMLCIVDPPEHSRSTDEKHQSKTEEKTLLEVDEAPEKTGPSNEEYLSAAEHKTLLEMTSRVNSTHQAFTEHRLSITIDTTPQSKFHNASGVTTPEILVITTPAAKEGACVPRKRKCLFDDMIVFPNNVIKQFIEDSSDLVSKRRKAPHTALAAWRACQVSSLPQCFSESLLPCTSSELRTVLCGKKLKISANVKVPPTFTSKRPTVGISVETVTPEKLDKSKFCIDDRLVEIMDSHKQSNELASPTVDRRVEAVELPEKLDMSESPIAGRSFVQAAIAPETPVLHAKSLRSFESPERPEISNLDRVMLEFERPEISNLDRVRLESKRAEKELSPVKEHELDLNMMNEEINSCEGDDQNQYGWSERTRVVMRCLHRIFLNQKKKREEEAVNLLQFLRGRTKKESARFFYEILMLKSKGYAHVKQENAYGDIRIWKASQWEQACGEDNAGVAGVSMYSES